MGKLAVREGHGGWMVGRTDRMVLETDAPYLGVKGEGRLHSPFMVRKWVGWLCRAWNLPRRVVSMILERNVVGLYQLDKKLKGNRGKGRGSNCWKKGGNAIFKYLS